MVQKTQPQSKPRNSTQCRHLSVLPVWQISATISERRSRNVNIRRNSLARTNALKTERERTRERAEGRKTEREADREGETGERGGGETSLHLSRFPSDLSQIARGSRKTEQGEGGRDAEWGRARLPRLAQYQRGCPPHPIKHERVERTATKSV